MSKFTFLQSHQDLAAKPNSLSDVMQVKQPVIVQILPELNLGGVERGTIEVARAIIAAGGKAVVISNGGQLVPQLQRLGAEHIKLPVHQKNPFTWGKTRRALRQILIQKGADIVHVRSRAPAWIALPVAKALNIKTVSTIHGRFGTKKIFKRLYNRKMLGSDHVIAISDYIKSQIDADFRKIDLSDKLTVIHRGVDPNYFDARAPKRVERP